MTEVEYICLDCEIKFMSDKKTPTCEQCNSTRVEKVSELKKQEGIDPVDDFVRLLADCGVKTMRRGIAEMFFEGDIHDPKRLENILKLGRVDTGKREFILARRYGLTPDETKEIVKADKKEGEEDVFDMRERIKDQRDRLKLLEMKRVEKEIKDELKGSDEKKKPAPQYTVKVPAYDREGKPVMDKKGQPVYIEFPAGQGQNTPFNPFYPPYPMQQQNQTSLRDMVEIIDKMVSRYESKNPPQDNTMETQRWTEMFQIQRQNSEAQLHLQEQNFQGQIQFLTKTIDEMKSGMGVMVQEERRHWERVLTDIKERQKLDYEYREKLKRAEEGKTAPPEVQAAQLMSETVPKIGKDLGDQVEKLMKPMSNLMTEQTKQQNWITRRMYEQQTGLPAGSTEPNVPNVSDDDLAKVRKELEKEVGGES